MSRAILNNTKHEIESMHVEGMKQTEIARQLKISQPTVSQHLNKPEVKELTQRLKEALQKNHAHKFIRRVVKTEQQAGKLNDYVLGLSEDNPTRYETPEQIEKALSRVDKTGLGILKGVGILDSNTIHFGDNNTQTNVISPAFQDYLNFQNRQNEIESGDVIDITPSDGVDNP